MRYDLAMNLSALGTTAISATFNGSALKQRKVTIQNGKTWARFVVSTDERYAPGARRDSLEMHRRSNPGFCVGGRRVFFSWLDFKRVAKHATIHCGKYSVGVSVGPGKTSNY